MNTERYLDYAITAMLIIVVVALVFVSSRKVKESFTELYFYEHTNLPKYVSSSANFTFAIHNMENKQYEYDILIMAELYNDTNASEPFMMLNISNFLALLRDNETGIFEENFSFPEGFEKAKIRVSIKNSTQDIHFWSFHAKEFQKYEEIGYGMLDCLREIAVKNFSRAEIFARGDYAQGLPTIASDVGNVKELLSKVDSKLILKNNSPQEINKNLKWFFELHKKQITKLKNRSVAVAKNYREDKVFTTFKNKLDSDIYLSDR